MTYWYDHDYPNDTKLHWHHLEDKSVELKLEFTSEDPDYGTDTLTAVGDPSCSFLDMCRKERDLITEFLDRTDDGIHRTIDGYDDIRDFSNTTLYAFEGILNHLINDIEGRMEKKMDRKTFAEGTKVRLTSNWNLMNIGTGNVFQFAKGIVGEVVGVNKRTGTTANADRRYLVKFRYTIDDDSKKPVLAWIESYHLEQYRPTKWYMTVREAGEMISKRLLEDRKQVFAFCASNAIEAKEDPENHNEDGGWHGIKRIDGFFDNDPGDFIVAIGYYGGGGVAFAYVNWEMADDSTCADELTDAIIRATGLDADSWLYVEEDNVKEEK